VGRAIRTPGPDPKRCRCETRHEVFLDHDIDAPVERLAQLDPHLAQIEQRELAPPRQRDHHVHVAVRPGLVAGKGAEKPQMRDTEHMQRCLMPA
jgi:hypothetical protein